MRGRHTAAMLKLLNLRHLESLDSKDTLYKIIEKFAKSKEDLSLVSSEILEKNKSLFNDKEPILAIDKFLRERANKLTLN
jgi:hypothetical protein